MDRDAPDRSDFVAAGEATGMIRTNVWLRPEISE